MKSIGTIRLRKKAEAKIVKSRHWKIVPPNLYDCLPTFVKLISASFQDSNISFHDNNKNQANLILLQIARRVFNSYNNNTNSNNNKSSEPMGLYDPADQVEIISIQKYNLINTPNDFVILLSKFSNEILFDILNFLLQNLTKSEQECLITFILKLEHMENSDNFARGSTLAGSLIKTIVSGSGVNSTITCNDFNNGQFFSKYILPLIKPLELLIEQNILQFAKYSHILKFKQDSFDMNVADDLCNILTTYIVELGKIVEYVPHPIKFICSIIDDLDFMDIKVKLTISSKPLQILTKNIIDNTSATSSSQCIANYVIVRSSNDIGLYYISMKFDPVMIDFKDVDGLFAAYANGKPLGEMEQLLANYHNKNKKFIRKFGLINVRFFGNLITKRCEKIFNSNSETGLILVSAINMLLIDAMQTLVTNKKSDDPHLEKFLTRKNSLILRNLYNQINSQNNSNNLQNNTSPDKTHNCDKGSGTTASLITNESLVGELLSCDFSPRNGLILDEYQIIYVALFEECLIRYRSTIVDINSSNNRRSGKMVREIDDFTITSKAIMTNRKLSLNDYCFTLDIIQDYLKKQPIDVNANKFYADVLEMSLHYIFRTIILPFTYSSRNKLSELYTYINGLMQSEFNLFEVMIAFQYIVNCGGNVKNSWMNLIDRLKDIIKADGNSDESYLKYLNHIKVYLEENYDKLQKSEAENYLVQLFE